MRNETIRIRPGVLNRKRLALGLTRLEFCERVGCNPRTGNRLLEGGRVRIVTARRVAEALNLPLRRVIDVERTEPCAPADTEVVGA